MSNSKGFPYLPSLFADAEKASRMSHLASVLLETKH